MRFHLLHVHPCPAVFAVSGVWLAAPRHELHLRAPAAAPPLAMRRKGREELVPHLRGCHQSTRITTPCSMLRRTWEDAWIVFMWPRNVLAWRRSAAAASLALTKFSSTCCSARVICWFNNSVSSLNPMLRRTALWQDGCRQAAPNCCGGDAIQTFLHPIG